MLAQKYYNHKQSCDQDGVIFSFSGFMSEEVLFALGDVLKTKVARATTDPNRVKRVFSVFVELVQNVIRYSMEGFNEVRGVSDKLGSGIIIVGAKDEQFYVGCGNVISREDKVALQNRLETYQKLDKTELRARYRKRLKEETLGDVRLGKGADLGLLEIYRRSNAPIEFDFIKIDDNKAFYYIKSYI